MISVINGNLLKKIIIACAESVKENRVLLDNMNVFPVPDGDTGSNMAFTISAAAKELDNLSDGATVSEVIKSASFGSLRGARGNSGVILSQLFRGFAKELDGSAVADAEKLASAMLKASETAYKAVMKPKEGTILTVAREIAGKALELAPEHGDIVEFLEQVIEFGNIVLGDTKEMLPVLKQADVVDAGGQGLMLILSAAYTALSGNRIKMPYIDAGESVLDYSLSKSTEDIKFGYCTEFFLNYEKGSFTQGDESEIESFLDGIGDSVVLVADDAIMKVHVHSNSPGAILEKVMKYGYLSNIKIENMRIQHSESIGFSTNNKPEDEAISNSPPKDVGFIAVSSGKGFDEIFLSLNVDAVIDGGQTQNPSTEEFLKAIQKVNADNIVIFPNNKNVILTAQQASHLCDGKKIHVVPSVSMPHGINALLSYMETAALTDNMERMINSLSEIQTGEITTAVRDSTMEQLTIKSGDILAILNGKIIASEKQIETATQHLSEEMLNHGSVFSIYYGSGIQPNDAEQLSEYITKKHPDIEVAVQYGGQQVYQYIFSIQ